MYLRMNNSALFEDVDAETGKKRVYAIDETPFM